MKWFQKQNSSQILLNTACILFIISLAAGCTGQSANSDNSQKLQQTNTLPAPSHTHKIELTPTQILAETPVQIMNIKDSYTASEKLEFLVVVNNKDVYFHGPCNMWFERKSKGDWKKVGYCPDSNFTDEPGNPGKEFTLTFPMSDESNIDYTYHLTPGTFRLAIFYRGTQAGGLIAYSPQFEIIE